MQHEGAPHGITRARFLHRDSDYIENEHTAGKVELKREDLAAFEVTFKPPFTRPLPPSSAGPTVDASSEPPSMHVGWVEVLMAQEGHLGTKPSPSQGNVQLKSAGSPPLIVWKQTRRLIVPQGVEEGATLRTVVPLQMESEARLGTYRVWARLTRSSGDTTTPWQKLDDVHLTAD